MSEATSGFLRFGGSSWRSKIDPKRPQERIKNNYGEHRTRRGEKNDNKDDNKRQVEVSKYFESV